MPAEPRPPVYLALDLAALWDLVAGRDVRVQGSQGRSASEQQPVEVRMALGAQIDHRDLDVTLRDACGQFLVHQLEMARKSSITPSPGGPAAPAPSEPERRDASYFLAERDRDS